MNDKMIYDRLIEHKNSALTSYNCDWFVLCAQGSMNYGMADDESDVDSKMLVLPNMRELILNSKAYNHVHIMENEEHVDMRDAREYFKIFRKSSINFVEILFTDYWICNPEYTDLWMELLRKKDELARINPYAAISCMKRMASENVHALCHEYPSRIHYINKYGYDGKQLSHLIRISYFINEYIKGSPYKDCIYPTNKEFRDYLLGIKRHTLGIDKEEALNIADNTSNFIFSTADKARKKLENKNDPELDEFLNTVLYELIKRTLKKELL